MAFKVDTMQFTLSYNIIIFSWLNRLCVHSQVKIYDPIDLVAFSPLLLPKQEWDFCFLHTKMHIKMIWYLF